MNTYFEEAYNLDLSLENRIKNADSAYALLENLPKEDSIKLKNVFKVANRYYNLFEYDKYLEVSKEAYKISKTINDTLQIAKAEYYIGDYYFKKFQSDSAFYYYIKAKEKFEGSTKKYDLANTTLHIAWVLLFENDFLGSEIQTIKALKIAQEIDDDVLIYECYDNLGRVLKGQKNYTKSLNYYFKSLDQINLIKEEVNSSLFEVQAYNNIGHVYLNVRSFNQALNYYKKALEIEETKTLYPILYASVLDYYAYTNFKLKKDAIDDFNIALKLEIVLTMLQVKSTVVYTLQNTI